MASQRKTLLAQLALMFGPQTDNHAVEAIGHIPSGSAARGALSGAQTGGGPHLLLTSWRNLLGRIQCFAEPATRAGAHGRWKRRSPICWPPASAKATPIGVRTDE